MYKWFFLFTLTLGLAVLSGSGEALAEMAKPWQLGLQDPVTPTAEKLYSFHNMLNIIIFAITFFVLGLLIYVVLKFNSKANPTPSKTTHNILIEVIWTAVPVLILVVIALPSLRVLYFMDRTEDADMTLKIIGHQWYWSYEYPDHGDFAFDSYLVEEEDLEDDQPRLLTVDNPVVVPVNTTIRLIMTSDDVMHNWAMPAFGVKMDTVPGRINETWMKVTKEGTYYGQCSELCGVNHGFMPITVKVVSKEEFAKWVDYAQEEFASDDTTTKPVRVAARNELGFQQ